MEITSKSPELKKFNGASVSIPASVRQTMRNLIIDILLLAGVVVANQPHFTGTPIHEWFSLIFAGAVIIHLLLHWSWMVAVVKRIFSKLPWSTRINAILDLLQFISITLVTLSGVMISRSVINTLGFSISPNFSWRMIHDLSANILIITVGLHIGMHWRWIVNALRRKAQPAVVS